MKDIEKHFLDTAKEFDVRIKKRNCLRAFMYLKKQDREAVSYDEIFISKTKTTLKFAFLSKPEIVKFLKKISGFSLFISCDEKGEFIQQIRSGIDSTLYTLRYSIGRKLTKSEKLNILANKRLQKL